jgi:SAM-dependent methyltransferase
VTERQGTPIEVAQRLRLRRSPARSTRQVLKARSHTGDALDRRFTGASPGASFDVVDAHQVLLHLRDPMGALREMLRVAKPGGGVAVRLGYPDAL